MSRTLEPFRSSQIDSSLSPKIKEFQKTSDCFSARYWEGWEVVRREVQEKQNIKRSVTCGSDEKGPAAPPLSEQA